MELKFFHVIGKIFIFLLVMTAQNNILAKGQKIILDSDLGSDIDDAFALALLLNSPELEILGITVGHGQTKERSKLACRFLYETEMDHIPVGVGRKTASIVGNLTFNEPTPRQFSWAKDFSKIKPIETPAATFIANQLRLYPKQVILITTGPVSNVAEVLQKDPEVLTLAKGIYSMLGSFYKGYDDKPTPSVEWNVRADIPSAIRLTNSLLPITYAGLDITASLKLKKEARQDLWEVNSPLTNSLRSLYQLWGKETPILYDVVPIGMILWPELFVTQPAQIHVTNEGLTIIKENQLSNAKVGIAINKEEFLRRVIGRLLNH